MTGFTESDAEDAVLDWLEGLGWKALQGPDIAPDAPGTERVDYGEVVLERRRRRDALARLNPGLPAAALDDAFRKLTRPEGAGSGSPQPRLQPDAGGRRDGRIPGRRRCGPGDAGAGCSLVTSVVCTCKGGSGRIFAVNRLFRFLFRIL